jgi:CBS domain-containing protein
MESRCRVYHGRGDVTTSHLLPCRAGADARPRVPTIADAVGVTHVMTRDLVCARPELRVDLLARLMVEQHLGCMPIVDERNHPVGMVTKFDLVEELGGDLSIRTAADIMMPIAFTLDEHATIAHAASLMALEDLHHVMIVSSAGVLLGLISSKDIVRWLVDNDQLAGAR